MGGQKAPRRIFNRLSSTGGLATPVSMLVIFFSLTLVSTITYYYAINRVDAKKEDLKMIAAEEKILDLEEAISAVAWSPGSARVISFSNYGGELHVEPLGDHLEINVTMGEQNLILFNSSRGRVLYQLPSVSMSRGSSWLRGDRRMIVNASFAYQAQVYIELGDEGQELRLGYRPLVSSSTGGLAAGRRINNIRIYVISMNGSEALSSEGELSLKCLCTGVSSRVHIQNLSSAVTVVSIKATLGGSEGMVEVPIAEGSSGSTIWIEVVVSHIELRRVSI